MGLHLNHTEPFRMRPWPEIHGSFQELASDDPLFQHMADVVASVLACGKTAELAGTTSMHDLIVARQPLVAPPYDVVFVRAPSSLRPVPSGKVVIEHLSTTGHDDRIERPVADTVPLFWRFMIEKFAVDSGVPSG